jgi:hypothetical protein
MFFSSIEKMVRTKISDTVEGIVLGLLETNLRYRNIQKELKSMGYIISLGSIRNIRNQIWLQRSVTSPNVKGGGAIYKTAHGGYT